MRLIIQTIDASKNADHKFNSFVSAFSFNCCFQFIDYCQSYEIKPNLWSISIKQNSINMRSSKPFAYSVVPIRPFHLLGRLSSRLSFTSLGFPKYRFSECNESEMIISQATCRKRFSCIVRVSFQQLFFQNNSIEYLQWFVLLQKYVLCDQKWVSSVDRSEIHFFRRHPISFVVADFFFSRLEAAS